MTGFSDADLRRDAFLGGRLALWQPVKGYRSGIDPVLLAASVPAKPGQSVLDLGCGAGAAGLCVFARVGKISLCGLEVQATFAALAARNGTEAGADFTVLEGDVRDPPAALKSLSFDFVIANPPYYDRGRGSLAPDAARETALGEAAPLKDWTRIAFKRLKPKGYFHLVIKADRLSDALSALDQRFGSVEVMPVAPRAGRAAELVLVRARKDGRAALRLLAPLVLHEGATHPGDKDHYTPLVSGILRRGAALPWPAH